MSIKGKSRFDFDVFGYGYDMIACNKQRYTRQEALSLYQREMQNDAPCNITEAFVRWRYGRDEDSEVRAAWWLEYEDNGYKSVPVWVIQIA